MLWLIHELEGRPLSGLRAPICIAMFRFEFQIPLFSDWMINLVVLYFGSYLFQNHLVSIILALSILFQGGPVDNCSIFVSPIHYSPLDFITIYCHFY